MTATTVDGDTLWPIAVVFIGCNGEYSWVRCFEAGEVCKYILSEAVRTSFERQSSAQGEEAEISILMVDRLVTNEALEPHS